ncbi:MAG: hypothetical protein LBS31_10175, partial [Candidatus Adiutrix sp.]|nr:hypothetical protein [Candidatus Adiutrix sp.]
MTGAAAGPAAAPGRLKSGRKDALTVISWDTATPWCVAAVTRFEAGGALALAEFSGREDLSHSRLLPPLMKSLLHEAGLKAGELDLAAVGRGPGS